MASIMAPTLLSSPSSSSSCSLLNHVSSTSMTFPLPKKRTQISCLSRKNTTFVHPIKSLELGSGLFSVGISHVGDVNPTNNRGDLVAAKATEVVAPTSEEQASSQSKPSKKAKKEKYPRRILDVYQILQTPVITEAAIKNISDENTLIFTVDVRADKQMIKDAVKNFFGVSVRKVNTSIRPDGTKKAFIMLSKEYNASDVAKSIGIFPK